MKRIALLILASLLAAQSAWSQSPTSSGLLTSIIVNDTSTGTTVNKLAKLTSAGKAIITATTDTDGAIGVVLSGAGLLGSAQISTNGIVTCAFDGTANAGDFVLISTSIAGDCSDSGSIVRPSGVQVIGRVLIGGAGAGSYVIAIQLAAPSEVITTLTFGTHLTTGGSSYNGTAPVTITSDATSLNTASTIVARDGSGNFSAGTITASLTGGASLDLPLAGGTMSGPIAMGGFAITGGGGGSFTTLSASSTVSGVGFSNYLASPPSIGSGTAGSGAFTTLSASSTVSGTGFSTYLASPPAIGGTAAAPGSFTTLSASSTVSGSGFSTYLASPPAIGGTTAAAGSFSTLSASSTISGTGFSAYLASPPAIGGTTAAAGSFTTLSASSTISGVGFSNYLASPPAIGSGTPAAGSFTTLNASGHVQFNGLTVVGTIAGSICLDSSGNIINSSSANCYPSGTANAAGNTTGQVQYNTGGTGGSLAANAGFTYDGVSVVSHGVAGTSVGGEKFFNATSGFVEILPPTGALGSALITLPAVTSTLATTQNVAAFSAIHLSIFGAL